MLIMSMSIISQHFMDPEVQYRIPILSQTNPVHITPSHLPKIDVEKTKCVLLSHHQDVGKNRDIKIAYRSFENMSRFKYSEI
jgi:hypothetical protein